MSSRLTPRVRLILSNVTSPSLQGARSTKPNGHEFDYGDPSLNAVVAMSVGKALVPGGH
jgi:hypothetical protein